MSSFLLLKIFGVATLIIATLIYWRWRLTQIRAKHLRSEAYYRSLIASMTEGLLVHGSDGQILTCNAAAARLLGQSEEALVGQALGHRLRREDGSPLPADQYPAMVSLRSCTPLRDQSLGLIDGSGALRWISLNSEPLALIPDQAPDAVLVTFTDVTKKVLTEQRLRESQERYDEIVRRIPVGIYTIKQQSGEPETLEYLSPRAMQILDITHTGNDDWPSIERLFEHILPEDRERLIRAQAVNIQEDFFWEGRIQVRGMVRWCRLESVAVPQSHDLCLWQGVLTDITAQKEAEAAMEQARQEAEAANRAKSDFLANMSHEIRTPMNSVLGMVQLCLETELTVTQRNYLDQAHRAARSLLALLNDILDLSKVEAGLLTLEHLPFNLSSVLGDLEAVIRRQAEDKGLTLRVECDPSLPDALKGDPARLRQILINLANNAIKFTECGEVEISARLKRLEPTQASIEFSVRDTGIGITEDQITGLFRAFHQVDTSITRRYGGTGLGLSICKSLAALMQGNIAVRSEPGVGSTFTFNVALELAPATWQPRSTATPNVHNRLAGQRILLVDDDSINRTVACTILARAGAEVEEADDGLAALTLIQQQGIDAWDLILMDVQMPELDGLETTRRIRARPDGTRIPILGLSARSLPEDVTAAQAAGMNAHLSKPIDLSHLLDEIAHWLGLHESAPTAKAPAYSPPTPDTLAAMQPVIERLITLTQAHDAEAEDYFQAHHDSLEHVLGPENCATLAQRIESYQFPEANALLTSAACRTPG